MPRVTVLAASLCKNAFSRSMLLADVFDRLGFDVEIHGLIIGPRIMPDPPPNRVVRPAFGKRLPMTYIGMRQIANRANGDIIVASKPALSSFGAGLTTAVGDIPEVVGDGGFVVPPGSVDALIDGIDQILGNPANARAVGEKGRARCVATYSTLSMARIVARAFREKNFPVPRNPED